MNELKSSCKGTKSLFLEEDNEFSKEASLAVALPKANAAVLALVLWRLKGGRKESLSETISWWVLKIERLVINHRRQELGNR